MNNPLIKVWIRQVIFSLLGGMIALGGLQLVLIVFNDFGLNNPWKIKEKQQQAGGLIAEGSPWVEKEYSQIIRKNQDGFRGPEFDAQSGMHLRVATVGDSFVEARQVAYEDCFSAIAETQLEGVQVMPIWVGNRGMKSRLDYFESIHSKLFTQKHPPLDIVVYCVRRGALRKGMQPTWQRKVYSSILKYSHIRGIVNLPIRSRCSALSLLSAKTQHWVTSGTTSKSLPLHEQSEKGVLVEVVSHYQKMSQDWNVQLAFLYLPGIDEADSPSTDSKEHSIKKQFFKILDERQIDYMDATKSVSPKSYFPIDRHPNELGHQQIGNALVSLITRIQKSNKINLTDKGNINE